MANQLSGIAVILFIAFGSVTFILLFIFAKRQITRFALKSRRGPHVAIGAGIPKDGHLFKEIERRLNAVEKIRCEPPLLKQEFKEQFDDEYIPSNLSPPHLYRMKAVDDLKEFCNLIGSCKLAKSREVQEDIVKYFLKIHEGGAFPKTNIKTLYKFLSLYEHARYQSDEFSYTEYCQYFELLQCIKNDIIQPSDVPESESEYPLDKSKIYPSGAHAQVGSTKSLLAKSFSSSSNSLNKKLTHETSV